MPPFIMMVFCVREEVDAIIDEYLDWIEEGLRVLFHGKTCKCDEAFIILEWKNPIPDKFYRKLQNDDDITDYIVLDASQSLTTRPQ